MGNYYFSRDSGNEGRSYQVDVGAVKRGRAE